MKRHQGVRGKGLVRGKAKEQFAYGRMIPRGRRVPSGGRRGDTWSYYPHTNVELEDMKGSIEMMYGHAKASLTAADFYTLFTEFILF